MDLDVAIIGGGAAGIAAGRRLVEAGVSCRIFEARPRLGGRAWTVPGPGGPIDLGCGWLHSADRNPWTGIAEAAGLGVVRGEAPWQRPALEVSFPRAEQDAADAAHEAFYQRLDHAMAEPGDRPAGDLLEPGNRWTPMIEAASTYISGAETRHVSARDLWNYEDSGRNWRVASGYGALIAGHAAGLPVALSCPVHRVDHSGRSIRLATGAGTVTAGAAIVTLPTRLIAEEAVVFDPPLPAKVDAAAGLPLGMDNKLYLALEGAEDFAPDSRAPGRTDRAATAAYHIRPLGRPVIECYFGGTLAAALEAEGGDAFTAFAVEELAGLFGAAFARRVRSVGLHMWGADPWAGGAYSYARPGMAECRRVLAEPVEERLFFAGEACSTGSYSTAHGAYLTGRAAAKEALAAMRRSARL